MNTDSVHSPAVDITNSTDHVEAVRQAFDLAEHEVVDTSAAFIEGAAGGVFVLHRTAYGARLTRMEGLAVMSVGRPADEGIGCIMTVSTPDAKPSPELMFVYQGGVAGPVNADGVSSILFGDFPGVGRDGVKAASGGRFFADDPTDYIVVTANGDLSGIADDNRTLLVPLESDVAPRNRFEVVYAALGGMAVSAIHSTSSITWVGVNPDPDLSGDSVDRSEVAVQVDGLIFCGSRIGGDVDWDGDRGVYADFQVETFDPVDIWRDGNSVGLCGEDGVEFTEIDPSAFAMYVDRDRQCGIVTRIAR